MNKKDMVSVFLKEGVLVTPDLLERINEENYEEILMSLKEKKKPKEENKPKKTAERKKEAGVKDFLDYYSRKYEFLKGILLKKMNAVSINKGKKIFSKTSIIGRVKEKTSRGFVIEDVTGEVEAVTEGKGTVEGDVIGLKGWFKEGGFLPEEFVWPDIPLANRGEPPNFLLTRKLTEKIKERSGKDVVISLDSEEIKTPDPRWIDVSHGERKVSALILRPENPIGEEGFMNFLKRRELPHERKAGIYTPYLIEKIPNIVWLIENKGNWTKNYRGVIVVSTDHESFFQYKENEGGKFEKI